MIELARHEMEAAVWYVALCREEFGQDVPEKCGYGDALLVYAMPMTRRMYPGCSISSSMK
jgi:hypothetical protein